MSKGIGGHHSHAMGKDEWLTPPSLLQSLGEFDLDPCSPVNRPWPTASRHLTIKDDGLSSEWSGSVFCNPPYGREAAKWLEKCASHGNCVALVFARTETEMWVKQVWGKADAVLFIYGRLYFHHVDGSRAAANSGAPSALIAYGRDAVEKLRSSGINGRLVELK